MIQYVCVYIYICIYVHYMILYETSGRKTKSQNQIAMARTMQLLYAFGRSYLHVLRLTAPTILPRLRSILKIRLNTVCASVRLALRRIWPVEKVLLPEYHWSRPVKHVYSAQVICLESWVCFNVFQCVSTLWIHGDPTWGSWDHMRRHRLPGLLDNICWYDLICLKLPCWEMLMF